MARHDPSSDLQHEQGPGINPDMWVDQFGDLLYRYALVRVADPSEAEELVQETFVSALQGLSGFRGGSAFSTWLVGILKHKIIDHFRRQSHLVEFADHDGQAEEWEQSQIQAEQYRWNADPQQLSEQRQLRMVFDLCLTGLSPQLRASFVLREMDGLSTAQICKELGLSPTNLWVRLYRARSALRGCLEDKWFTKGPSSFLGKPRRGPGRSNSRPKVKQE